MAEVSLPGTTALALDGPSGAYRIFLSVPQAPPPPEGFPLLVLLDANLCFGTVADLLRQGSFRPGVSRLCPAVVAGIAYPTDQPLDRLRRSLDYTPGPSVEGPGRGAPSGPPTGGRNAFLAFLQEQVKPLVAARHPLDPARQAIIGHSLAGFFALDVLAQDPACFSAYLAISPSVWWNRPRLMAGLESRKGNGLAPRAWIGVGEWEEALAPWEDTLPDREATARRRASRAMVGNARTIADTIARRFGPAARVEFECLPRETHISAVPVALSHGLRFLLGPEGFGGP